MGNTALSSSDLDSVYGRTTEQIDGVLTLKKQASPTKNTKHRLRELYISWNSQKKQKRVKSILVRLILERNWQKVLIRARLNPREIHEFVVLEVPLPISDGTKGSRRSTMKGGSRSISYSKVKVLPIHIACSLRPPPVVVRALLSHAVSSAFSNDGMIPKKVFGKPTRGNNFQHLSVPTPLHHEHNTSFATVAVERLEESSIRKEAAKKLSKIRKKARNATFNIQRSIKLRRSSSTTEQDNFGSTNENTEDCYHVSGPKRKSQDSSPDHYKNNDDVALFLKQMEDHLAHNGRCQSVFRDTNHSPKSSNHEPSEPRFVLDIDPAVLLPSPSAVRVMEKRHQVIGRNRHDDDLFSLENSVGDSNTASQEYLSDDSSVNSSVWSLLQEPPSCDSDSCDNISKDGSSLLQLTTDGKLALLELEDDSNKCYKIRKSKGEQLNKYCESVDSSLALMNVSHYSESNTSSEFATNSKMSKLASSDPTFSISQPTFVPEVIRVHQSKLFQSLPLNMKHKKGHEKDKHLNERIRSATTNGNETSRLLPIHIACLYGASAEVLKILLEEYREGSSVEVLGMLPIHMVAAKWSLVSSEENDSGYDCGGSYSVEGFDSEMNRIAALVECSPGSLWAKSSVHGLRPLEYTRNLLCYPSNAADEGMIRTMKYLGSQEKCNSPFDFPRPVTECKKIGYYSKNKANELNLREKEHDAYCNQIIQSTSTCTTSGLSSAWLTNDSSSVYSSASTAPKASHISLGILLAQSRWKEAMDLVESNPDTVKERCFSRSTGNFVSGNDISFSSSSSSGLKEQLPIHIVCQSFKNGDSVPIDLVETIISSHPEALMETDDEGSLPLHLLCDSFRRHKHKHMVDSHEAYRVFVSERLQALQIMLSRNSHASQVVDNRGRLPLHRAVLVGAPLEAIQLLVYQYPKAISIPDRKGMKPFCLAKKVYVFGNPVIQLLRI